MAHKVAVKNILTEEEINHINVLRESMESSRSLIGLIFTWMKVKKIIRLAEDRYQRGVRTNNLLQRVRYFS
ncbi:hypothetical protein [Bacillus sp. RO1]|uniref:hypothetical protein n=1 Tax=Bacillus sp. RO1 TaxID=2722703 RepID=UPI00145776D4|nr:hypothetical protein [Bacillus sp. RO1]NLP52043.1 hypothetical protein [Bacillus sp. RO1]